MRRSVAHSAAALAVVGVAACGAGQAAAPDSAPPTVAGVGELPAELTRDTEPATSTSTTTTTDMRLPSGPRLRIDGTTEYELPIGRTVSGNRLLVIGDSILASISDRYGGQLCDRLVPLGWAVEVDAESGRDVTFGQEVLDERLAAGWDAAVVMLGNNYRDDVEQFAADLEQIVTRLAPRPTVLITVTEFQESRAEVNFVVRTLAREHPSVRLVEWASRTRDADELLGDDGLHLSEQGRVELARMISLPLLGVPGVGECLDSDYDDDSRAPEIPYDDDDDSDDGSTPPPADPDPAPTPDPDPDPTPAPTVPVTEPEPTSPPEPEPTSPPEPEPEPTSPPAPDPTSPPPDTLPGRV
jgi:lysophospholipase L1-like esterase